MKWFFEEIDKLHLQWEAVENLSWYDWWLSSQQSERIKKEITREVIKTIQYNSNKFDKILKNK